MRQVCFLSNTLITVLKYAIHPIYLIADLQDFCAIISKNYKAMSAIDFKRVLMLALSIAVVTSACKKDDDPEPEPIIPAQPAPPVTPAIGDADAAHWAVRVMTSQEVPLVGTVDVAIGMGVAVYFSETGSSTLVEVGTAKVEGSEMTKYDNNSYALLPGTTNPNGIDFENEVTWEITGANGFSAFSHTDNSIWPTVTDITSSTTVSKAGYTMTLSGVNNADSVLFILSDVQKTIAGNATSCTFTAAELAASSTGDNIMMAAVYRSNSSVINSKNMYFGKEVVRTKSVTITE